MHQALNISLKYLKIELELNSILLKIPLLRNNNFII
jgi:hypothetical protein